MKIFRILLFSICSSALVFFLGCKSTGNGPGGVQLSTSNRVVQHVLNELERLNPQNSTGADETYVEEEIFERLLRIDPKTSEVNIPWLAESMPVESADHMTYDFTLRKGVKFADGHELTGADVIFSLKALKNPLSTYSAQKRNYVDGVHSAELIDGDPYKVRFKLSKPYFLAKEQIFGDNLYILPKHIFDPKGLTDQYSWDDIAAIIEKGGNPDNLDSAKISKLKTNPAMKEFADWMVKPELGRDPKYIFGSGPYKLAEWRSSDQIILIRNPLYTNKGNSILGEIHPDTLIYKLIADWNAAVTALKSRDIDLIYFLQPPYFTKIDTTIQPFLKKTTFPLGSYILINWNLEEPYFKDVKVRWALAHLIDRKTIIDKVLGGLAKQTQSPTPFWRKEYNKDIPLITYDVALAKRMLDSAGWKDHDGDGILDKEIDGKLVPFKFTFITNVNEVRKQVLLIIAESFHKVGIDAGVQTTEWSVFLDRLRDHHFEAAYGAWQNDPYETDNYQLYHSSQAKNRGSNYSSYSSPRADHLLESIRSEFDEAKRMGLQKEFQQVFYEDQGNCLLWVPENPAVWVDRFDNVSWNSVRPGFNQSWWKIRGASGGGVKQVSAN